MKQLRLSHLNIFTMSGSEQVTIPESPYVSFVYVYMCVLCDSVI